MIKFKLLILLTCTWFSHKRENQSLSKLTPYLKLKLICKLINVRFHFIIYWHILWSSSYFSFWLKLLFLYCQQTLWWETSIYICNWLNSHIFPASSHIFSLTSAFLSLIIEFPSKVFQLLYLWQFPELSLGNTIPGSSLRIISFSVSTTYAGSLKLQHDLVWFLFYFHVLSI